MGALLNIVHGFHHVVVYTVRLYCRFRFLLNFSDPYLGNLWLVQLGNLHCSLWPVQTINFPGMRAREFERK